MKRNPLYVFENTNSVGINTVPLKSMVQINDMDGAGHPVTVQLTDRSGLGAGTTIGEFLLLTESYSISGDSIFLNDDQIGVPNGIAPLDAQGKVPGDKLPTLAGTAVFVTNSEAEMVATVSKEGDTCVRLDLNKSFIKIDDNIGTINSWVELAAVGAGTVSSVNAKAGNVTLTTSDITEDTNLYYTDVRSDNRILAAIDDNSGVGSIDKLWSSAKIDSEIQSLTFDDTLINTRIQTIEDDYAFTISDNVFQGVCSFQQEIAVNGDILAYGNIISSVEIDVGLDTNNNSTIGFNYGHPTKGMQYIYLDNTDDLFKIKDTNGISYTMYHSGVLNPDLKLNVTDGVSYGTAEIQKGGAGDTAALRIRGTATQDTDLRGVYQAGDLYFIDESNGDKYGIKADNTNKQLDFKVNEVTSLTLAKNVAPATQHAPTEVNHLTRKDYVDTKLSLSGGIMQGHLNFENSYRINLGNEVDGNSIITGQGKDGGAQGDWYIGRGTGDSDLVSFKNRLGSKTSSVGLDTNGEVVITKTLTINNDEAGGSKNTLILRASNTSVDNEAGIVFVDGLLPKWGMRKDTDNNFVIGYIDGMTEVQSIKLFNDGTGVQFDLTPTTLNPAVNPQDLVRKDYVDAAVDKTIKVQDPAPGEPWEDGYTLVYDANLDMFVAGANTPLFGATIDRPTQPPVGTTYFDTTIDKPTWYNGTSYIDATGAVIN